MSSELLIRPAAAKDAVAIADIHLVARASAMPWLPVIHSPAEVLAFFQDVVLPTEFVQVATKSQIVTGFISTKDGWVNHLYIAPSAWRGGIGSALIEKAKSDAKRLQLWTFQQNAAARAFYAQHGFQETELTDGSNNEERTPDVRMTWARDS